MKRYWLKIENINDPIEIPNNTVISIGRSNHSDIVLNYGFVSRTHCLIDNTSEPAILIDGNGSKLSKNGCKVNGVIYGGEVHKNKQKTVFLYNNDIIEIGDISILYLTEDYDSQTFNKNETH